MKPTIPASTKKVTFGSVTVDAFVPTPEEVSRNILAGQSALARALKVIVKPGVRLEVAKGVPLFHADPDHPRRIVRVLDGKRERGVFEGGEFKKTDLP